MNYVYKATSKTSGKSYIGKTKYGLHYRQSQHKYEAKNTRKGREKQHIHRAIAKYGYDDFEWEIIFQSPHHTIVCLAEIELTHYYDTYKNGYNMKLGEDGYLLDNSKKYRKRQEIARRDIRRREYGSTCLPETRDKHSKNKQGKSTNGSRYRISTPSDEVFIVPSLSEFADKMGFHRSCLYKVVNGKRPHHKGYKAERIT
ncbi:hypothetical protein N9937_01980 [bacterium]|nr:hypothetical protein [bacterium]